MGSLKMFHLTSANYWHYTSQKSTYSVLSLCNQMDLTENIVEEFHGVLPNPEAFSIVS